jgi:hypothetical protein
MGRQFGDKYKSLINKNPGQKSEFNTDPGNEQGLLRTKNPYAELIEKWDFTKITPSAPFIGRDIVAPLVDLYYVVDGYVEEIPERYEEIKQVPAW